MLFTDFVEQADIIDELRAEDHKNQMVAAAFLHWQSGTTGKPAFADYLKSMGLAEKSQVLTNEQKKVIAKKAMSKAERIVAMDKRRKRKT